MYLRTTILICVLGAGGLYLHQHPSASRLAGFRSVVINPHVQPEADTADDPSKADDERRLLIALAGLAGFAIVGAALMDRMRNRKPREEDFVYRIPTSKSGEVEPTAMYGYEFEVANDNPPGGEQEGKCKGGRRTTRVM